MRAGQKALGLNVRTKTGLSITWERVINQEAEGSWRKTTTPFTSDAKSYHCSKTEVMIFPLYSTSCHRINTPDIDHLMRLEPAPFTSLPGSFNRDLSHIFPFHSVCEYWCVTESCQKITLAPKPCLKEISTFHLLLIFFAPSNSGLMPPLSSL